MLVERVRAVTARWVATDTIRVLTSGPSRSRVEHGFAGYLADLDPETGGRTAVPIDARPSPGAAVVAAPGIRNHGCRRARTEETDVEHAARPHP